MSFDYLIKHISFCNLTSPSYKMNSSSILPFPPSPVLSHSLNSRGELGMFVNPYTCSCSTCKDYLAGRTPEAEEAVANAGTGEQPESTSVAILTASEEVVVVPQDKHSELRRLEERFEEQWYAAGGGTLRSPSLGGTSTTWYLGAGLEEIQERRKELGLPEYSPPTYKPLVAPSFGKQATEPAVSSTTLEDMLRECRQPRPLVQPSLLRSVLTSSLTADRCPAYGCENPLTCACPRAEPRAIAVEDEDNRPSRFRGYAWMGRRFPATTSGSVPQGRLASSASGVPNLPPPPPLVRVNAFADCLGRNPLDIVDEEDVLEQLSSLRSKLQLRRDHPTSLDIDNEEAVEAADRRYAELTAKIQAIESVLQAFGIPFRNP